jgi:hypothetical protein
MIPAFAVAYWVSTHSAQLGAQMPSRSPLASPAASSPRASASTCSFSAAYVSRTSWWRTTSASRSPKRATVRSRFSPIVSPISGLVATPDA